MLRWGRTGAEKAAKPSPHDLRLAQWRAARFGMFIHWGPVSLTGTEISWSRGAGVPIDEYDNLYKRFNPVRFDAEAWVKTAKDAGMKYIVLTTKHHDGFCLWDTMQTDYNIMHSPFHRDVVKELAAACKRQGIRFGTYYSVTDWHHPKHPLGSPGGTTHKPTADLEGYTVYLKRQLAELIGNYGPLDSIWFDVAQCFDAARGQSVIDYARSLQPDILVNNRSGAAGDYDTPEQTVGGFQDRRPWETCMTICNQWAWRPNDSMKSLKQCLQTLVSCVGGDGNLLFNVGLRPWANRAAAGRTAQGNGPVAGQVRREHLRHPRRPVQADPPVRLHPQGQRGLPAYIALDRRLGRAAGAAQKDRREERPDGRHSRRFPGRPRARGPRAGQRPAGDRHDRQAGA